ncbi:MAG: serpin family protein [Bacteroidales bacterium]|nr:serpin family protein [Bacteroidales bacterium]
MKIHALILVIPVLLSIGCKKETPAGPKDPKPVNLTAKASQVIANSNEFGIDLFRETAVLEEGNLMLSPLSAGTALSMLLNGCNSGTYTQIRDMLGYQDLTMEEINDTYQSLVAQLLTIDPEINLTLANSVWYRQGFEVKSPFIERLETAYQARTEALDFNNPSAVNTINGWASDNTNGKIDKVLDNISPDAVMFLMNALYFKGRWTYQFDNSLTSPFRFNPENGDGANVPMMMGNFPYRKYSDNLCTAVELNYGQQNYAMDIIVPNGSLSSYLQQFTGDSWLAITAGLDAITNPLTAEIVIPKFKFEYEKYLNDQLQALGMTDAFNPELADLTGISDEDIFVSFVKQNTFVDVNEEGTEAAAVTTIGIEVTSAPEPVVVDKPFIFAIRERLSNTLLFIGKVEMPEYE